MPNYSTEYLLELLKQVFLQIKLWEPPQHFQYRQLFIQEAKSLIRILAEPKHLDNLARILTEKLNDLDADEASPDDNSVWILLYIIQTTNPKKLPKHEIVTDLDTKLKKSPWLKRFIEERNQQGINEQHSKARALKKHHGVISLFLEYSHFFTAPYLQSEKFSEFLEVDVNIKERISVFSKSLKNMLDEDASCMTEYNAAVYGAFDENQELRYASNSITSGNFIKLLNFLEKYPNVEKHISDNIDMLKETAQRWQKHQGIEDQLNFLLSRIIIAIESKNISECFIAFGQLGRLLLLHYADEHMNGVIEKTKNYCCEMQGKQFADLTIFFTIEEMVNKLQFEGDYDQESNEFKEVITALKSGTLFFQSKLDTKINNKSIDQAIEAARAKKEVDTPSVYESVARAITTTDASALHPALALLNQCLIIKFEFELEKIRKAEARLNDNKHQKHARISVRGDTAFYFALAFKCGDLEAMYKLKSAVPNVESADTYYRAIAGVFPPNPAVAMVNVCQRILDGDTKLFFADVDFRKLEESAVSQLLKIVKTAGQDLKESAKRILRSHYRAIKQRDTFSHDYTLRQSIEERILPHSPDDEGLKALFVCDRNKLKFETLLKLAEFTATRSDFDEKSQRDETRILFYSIFDNEKHAENRSRALQFLAERKHQAPFDNIFNWLIQKSDFFDDDLADIKNDTAIIVLIKRAQHGNEDAQNLLNLLKDIFTNQYNTLKDLAAHDETSPLGAALKSFSGLAEAPIAIDEKEDESKHDDKLTEVRKLARLTYLKLSALHKAWTIIFTNLEYFSKPFQNNNHNNEQDNNNPILKEALSQLSEGKEEPLIELLSQHQDLLSALDDFAVNQQWYNGHPTIKLKQIIRIGTSTGRSKQEVKERVAICKWQLQEADLRAKGAEDAATRAGELSKELEEKCDAHYCPADDEEKSDEETYKGEIKTLLTTDQNKVFSEHNTALYVLANIGIAVGLLGIGYLIAMAINYNTKGSPFFFANVFAEAEAKDLIDEAKITFTAGAA